MPARHSYLNALSSCIFQAQPPTAPLRRIMRRRAAQRHHAVARAQRCLALSAPTIRMPTISTMVHPTTGAASKPSCTSGECQPAEDPTASGWCAQWQIPRETRRTPRREAVRRTPPHLNQPSERRQQEAQGAEPGGSGPEGSRAGRGSSIRQVSWTQLQDQPCLQGVEAAAVQHQRNRRRTATSVTAPSGSSGR